MHRYLRVAALGREGSSGVEDRQFWKASQDRLFYQALVPIQIATGGVTAQQLQDFISTAAHDKESLAKPQFKEGFHYKVMRAAYEAQKSPSTKQEYDNAYAFWFTSFPELADKTRSGIMVGVENILHAFNTGMVAQLLSSTTNVTPDLMRQGKFLFIDTAPTQYGDVGRFIATAWKYVTQWAILRYVAKPQSGFCVIWSDEAQQLINSFDAQFLAQSRSHKAGMVLLTQSIHSLLAELGGWKGESYAETLFANCSLKIAHALGTSKDAEWAANLIGRRLTTFTGGSIQPPEDTYDGLFNPKKVTTSFSEHYEFAVQPAVFQTNLRTGGRDNGLLADAYVIRSGQPFSHGENYLRVAFSQKD